jgi:hypothetical protein
MSATDWALHKLVLHNDASPIMMWREAHWVHHREYDGAMLYKTGASLTFPHPSTAGIVMATLPIALLLGLLWVDDPRGLIWVAAAHAVCVTLAIGVHNYAHSSFHEYEVPSWAKAPCVPVPMAVQRVLHEHHERHHADARVNLCTVLLGFDWLACTDYVDKGGEQRMASECAEADRSGDAGLVADAQKAAGVAHAKKAAVPQQRKLRDAKPQKPLPRDAGAFWCV